MKVTICELPDDPTQLEKDWMKLVEHVQQANSDLMVLPEMPFSPWLAASKDADATKWQEAVETHERWLTRLPELAPAVVASSCPIIEDGYHYNEGFLWDAQDDYRAVHRKVYLPDEEEFWEARWYQPGKRTFQAAGVAGYKVGFLLCTEMWFTQHAMEYAQQGIHLLLSPRATLWSTAEKWIAGGQAAAVMSGAFCLGANRTGTRQGEAWGSHGWIIDPDGKVLGLTSPEQPCLTLEIDLAEAEAAKQTYPRYVYVE